MKQTILELIFFRIITFEEAREHEITVDEKLVRQKTETYRKNINMKAFIEKFMRYQEAFGDLQDEEKPDIVIVMNQSKKGNRYVSFDLMDK